MFTGIIEAVGHLARIDHLGGDGRYLVHLGELAGQPLALGDSVAVNGVCLTVIAFDAQHFSADVSAETLSCTTLGRWAVGDRVNLERAVTPNTRLGGHLVSGHVDGLSRLLSRHADQRSVRMQFSLPDTLCRYVAKKGSICIDGISLTVNDVGRDQFSVNIVPHTLAKTTLESLAIGNPVNLEIDVIARYVERMFQFNNVQPTHITEGFLAEHGFMK
jgi:riboflavin synthase